MLMVCSTGRKPKNGVRNEFLELTSIADLTKYLVTHQAAVARQFKDGLHTITGNSNNILARRPFFVPWFMAQMNRSVQ